MLSNTVLGNPHSSSPSSMESSRKIEAVKERILNFFDAADEYEVVFTSNATAALKLVGESYPFDRKRTLVLTADNHNSVNGIREYAKSRGASVTYAPLNPELRVDSIKEYLEGKKEPGLFAFPAQSNFSGVKHPLAWIRVARDLGHDVLLDAAAFVSTNPISLRRERPDYFPVSFYKMFGFPTGVGALLVRNGALKELARPWFSGGTIRYISTANQVHLLEDGARAFEDGTVNFLGIAALTSGFELLERVGIENIREHVSRLVALLLDELKSLKHGNGSPLVRIYGPVTTHERGGTVAFNLLDPEGLEIDAQKVGDLAAADNVSVRTGCFCNPGAAEYAFGYDPILAKGCFESMSRESFTLRDFSSCMKGKPVGAVRASLGIASNENDVERLVAILKRFADAGRPAVESRASTEKLVAALLATDSN